MDGELMGIYSKHKMFCTVCGKQYDWDCNYGFSKNRTCGMDCHREFEWRHILSVLGKDYYLRKKLGLDFGNVIKVNGGDMIIGFKEAIQPLKKVVKEESSDRLRRPLLRTPPYKLLL